MRVRGLGASTGALMAVVATAVCVAAPGSSAAAASLAQPFDFNGDAYVDLAVGVPGEALGSLTGAGAVNVIYGTASGLSPAGNQFWTQDSPGVPGAAERWDGFGE